MGEEVRAHAAGVVAAVRALASDNHTFKVATTAKGRKLLAKRRVRGVYRQAGKSLQPAHVKPSAKQHLS